MCKRRNWKGGPIKCELEMESNLWITSVGWLTVCIVAWTLPIFYAFHGLQSGTSSKSRLISRQLCRYVTGPIPVYRNELLNTSQIRKQSQFYYNTFQPCFFLSRFRSSDSMVQDIWQCWYLSSVKTLKNSTNSRRGDVPLRYFILKNLGTSVLSKYIICYFCPHRMWRTLLYKLIN
jgi:hypothetical protein